MTVSFEPSLHEQGWSYQRPRLLCLHGGGSSAAIFQIQIRKLQHILKEQFDFVFVNGPIESSAGPGVLPIFEGCGPYYRWVRDNSQLTTEEQFQEQEGALAYLRTFIEEQGPFAGIVGFSQGARVASGLLLEEQAKQEFQGLPLFGIFICGTYPPLHQNSDQAITLPTVHACGLRDPWRGEGEALYKHCAGNSDKSLMKFPGSHAPPLKTEDMYKLAAIILATYDRHLESQQTGSESDTLSSDSSSSDDKGAFSQTYIRDHCTKVVHR